MVLMQDFITGLLAILVGGLICFWGYVAMRIAIPIWGAFTGFMLGAGVVDNITDDGFLRSVLAWIVGICVALLFGAFAYLYYEVCVFLAMTAVGFALGASLMVALGVTWSWVIVLAGAVVGALLAMVAIVGHMPTVFLIVLTAMAGASAIVFGLLLWTGGVNSGDFETTEATKLIDDDWWWYVLFVVLALAGCIGQSRFVTNLRASVREQWTDSGGRQLSPR